MKAAKVTMISLIVAIQLAWSMSTVTAFADNDVLSNSSLPMAQPKPSKLVQRIWNSIDLQHNTKKRSPEIAAKQTSSQPAEDPAAVSARDADAANTKTPDLANEKNTETASVDGTCTSTSAASPGQMILEATNAQNNALKAGANVNGIASSGASSGAASTASIDGMTARISVQATTGVNLNGSSTIPKEIEPAKDGQTSALSKDVETSEFSSPLEKSSPVASSETSRKTSVESIEKEDKPFEIASVLNTSSLPPGSVLSRIPAQTEEVIVVDNDEAQEVEETQKYESMPLTDDGKVHAKAGARFPIVLASQVNSKTAKQGDLIKARLKYDLKIGDKLVAKKGSIVGGHINYVLPARTIMHSLFSPERWYRNSGCLGLSFDEIVNEKGEHLPLVAQPSQQARIVKNKAEGRELGVNHNGQVVGPWSEQIRYKCIRVGLNLALAPAGVFTFGAMPVALGVLGAASPSFAFAKPVGLNVRHRRLKGFAWGFLSGIPGSFLIEDTTIKGQEAIVKPGDEFYAELVQEFTGEPSAEAELLPGSSTKVHGQILKAPKKVEKKKQ